MKKLSRLLAVVLAVLMIATAFAGCHKKDEIAFTIGDTKFTSAMFSCTQFFVANSVRSTIDTYISDNELDSTNVKYENYYFDSEGNVAATGTSYEKYVRAETIKTMRQNAAIADMMKKKNFSLDQDTVDSYTLETACYWNYGCDYSTYYQYAASGMDPSSYYTPYGLILEANGVGYDTFLEYRKYDAMYSFIFEKLYTEEGGEKEISKDDLIAFMTEHYVLADYLTFSKNDDSGNALSDEKLKELKSVIDGYAERLNNGEKFEAIDKDNDKRLEDEEKANSSSSATGSTSSNASSEVSSSTSTNSSTASDSTTTSSSTTSSEDDEKYSPEEWKGLFGDEEAGYDNAMFAEYKKQEVDKAVVLEDTENSQYILFVKLDMLDEMYGDYWYDYLKTTVAYNMKQEEFDGDLDNLGGSFKLDESTFATSPFDVKDIKFTVE